MYEKYPIVLATAAFIMDAQGRILIVKKSHREQIDPGLWVVPGGKVLPDEPILTSLKREIKEEVGLDIDSYQWIGEDVFISHERYFHAQHFLCTVRALAPITLEEKLEEYAWVTPSTVKDYHFAENLKKRILEIYATTTHGS